MRKFSRFVLMAAFSALFAVTMLAQTEDSPVKNAKGLSGADVTTMQPQDPHYVAPPAVRSANIPSKFTQSVTPGSFSVSPRAVRTAASSTTMPKLIGNVIYSKTLQSRAMYEIATTATGEFTQLQTEVDATNGGVCVDGVYYAVSSSPYGFNKYNVKINSYDADTWALIESRTSEDAGLIADDVALDPVTGRVYGCFMSDDCMSYVFGYIDYTTLKRTAIKTNFSRLNAIAIDSNGVVYGVQMDGNLVKIDKETGATTVVGSTGLSPRYSSSATIDTATNRMFYAISDSKNKSYLVELNTTDGSATQILQYSNDDEITGLYVPTPPVPDAPKPITDLALNFVDNSLSGTIEFTAPATNNSGAAGTGSLSYTVTLDDNAYTSGTMSYGEKVSIPLTVTAPGIHSVTVVASNAAGKSSKVKTEEYIGSGVPKAPVAKLEREGDNFNVTWNKVTETAAGGYFNAEKVTYKVTRYPDEVVVAAATADTAFVDNVAEPGTLTAYYYTVEAMFDGMTSAAAKTNSIVIGKIVPPYKESFDTEESVQGYTIINANNDYSTWEWQKGGYMRVRYDSRNKTDDWLITPAIKLEKNKTFKVSFDVWGTNSRNQEIVEVKYGKGNAAEAMHGILLEPDTLLAYTSDSPKHISMRLHADEDGVYYIGFHGMSDANKYGLNLDNIEIEAGVSTSAPAAPSNLVVTPAADGSKKATVKFTCPTKNTDGSDLESISKMELSRGESVIKTFDNPAVGSEITYEDVVPASGSYTYKVVAYGEYGAGTPAETTVRVGSSAPVKPTSITIAETGNVGEVKATWAAVTEDVDGRAIDAADVTYTLLDDNNEVVAAGITGTSFTFQAVKADAEQTFVYYYLKAVNGGLESEANYSNMIPVGTPYAVPFVESIAGGKTGSIFGLRTIKPTGTWQIGIDGMYSDISSADGDGGYLFFRGDNVDASASISTGKINLDGVKNPALSVYVDNLFNSDGLLDMSELDIYAIADGTETLLNHIVCKDLPEVGWNKVVMGLDAFAGKEVYFKFVGTVKNYRNTVIDQIKVYSRNDDNIAITDISAPANTRPGKEFNIAVKVENTGKNTAEDWSLRLSRNGEVLSEQKCEAIAAGVSTQIELTVTPTVLTDKSSKYAVDVVYANDNIPEDNHAEVTVNLILPNYPVVENVYGNKGASGLELKWTAPDLAKAAPEETFEDFEKATSWTNTYANWTFVDYDKSPVMGINGVDLPNVAVGSLQSFFVMEYDEDIFAASTNKTRYMSHSGVKHLSSMGCYYENVASDDWAISPELFGGQQLISFYAKSYSAYYKENLEVLYSTTGTDRADFKSLGDNTEISNEWKLYEYELPQGAKYFALRSHGMNNWMCFIDDVTYTGTGSPAKLSILGYNIYRDGVKINPDVVDALEYTDTEASGKHSYVVTAVYDRGESQMSPVFSFDPVGVSAINADSSAPVEYFNIQGMQIPADNLVPGIYVRRQGSNVDKVVIK